MELGTKKTAAASHRRAAKRHRGSTDNRARTFSPHQPRGTAGTVIAQAAARARALQPLPEQPSTSAIAAAPPPVQIMPNKGCTPGARWNARVTSLRAWAPIARPRARAPVRPRASVRHAVFTFSCSARIDPCDFCDCYPTLLWEVRSKLKLHKIHVILSLRTTCLIKCFNETG